MGEKRMEGRRGGATELARSLVLSSFQAKRVSLDFVSLCTVPG